MEVKLGKYMVQFSLFHEGDRYWGRDEYGCYQAFGFWIGSICWSKLNGE
jgi:hypothetical protein